MHNELMSKPKPPIPENPTKEDVIRLQEWYEEQERQSRRQVQGYLELIDRLSPQVDLDAEDLERMKEIEKIRERWKV